MRERIKHNIDIVTVPNGPTFLVSVVNPSYYNILFNEGTAIVDDDYLFFQIPCCREISYWPWIRIWCHCKPLAHLIYTKPISLMVGSSTVYGIIFYQAHLLPWITTPLFLKFWRCCIWLLDHLNIFIRIFKSML